VLEDPALVSVDDSSYCFERGRDVGAMIKDLNSLIQGEAGPTGQR
jgi:hypothetical protein